MNKRTNLLTLSLESSKAVQFLMERFAADGLQVKRSFDLRAAMADQSNCPCPHHGEFECDCQLIVLLVYDEPGAPLTLIAHGKDNTTHFALANPAEHEQEGKLKTKILQAIALEGFSAMNRC